jgi:hypothetical protein
MPFATMRHDNAEGTSWGPRPSTSRSQRRRRTSSSGLARSHSLSSQPSRLSPTDDLVRVEVGRRVRGEQHDGAVPACGHRQGQGAREPGTNLLARRCCRIFVRHTSQCLRPAAASRQKEWRRRVAAGAYSQAEGAARRTTASATSECPVAWKAQAAGVHGGGPLIRVVGASAEDAQAVFGFRAGWVVG